MCAETILVQLVLWKLPGAQEAQALATSLPIDTGWKSTLWQFANPQPSTASSLYSNCFFIMNQEGHFAELHATVPA